MSPASTDDHPEESEECDRNRHPGEHEGPTAEKVAAFFALAPEADRPRLDAAFGQDAAIAAHESATVRAGAHCELTTKRAAGVRLLTRDLELTTHRDGDERRSADFQSEAIHFSTATDSRGIDAERLRIPVFVTSTSSSIRTPIPRYFFGTVRSSG